MTKTFFRTGSSKNNSNSTIQNIEATPVAETGIPKSCADLRYMRHSANGLYLIMGTEKIETVYCDFSVLPSNASKIIFYNLRLQGEAK